MKKKTTFFLLCLIALGSYAQDSLNIKTRKWYVGTSFSADYCYRILRSDDEDFSSFRLGIDRAGLGLTGGLAVRRDLNTRWQLESGLIFSRHRLTSQIAAYDQNQQLLGTADLKHDYHFIQIPVRVNFIFLERTNWRYFATSGLGLSFTTKALSKGVSISKDGRQEKFKNEFTDAEFPWALFGMLGVGSEYRAGSNLKVGAMLLYRQHLTQIYKGTDVSVKDMPMAIGFNLFAFYEL